MSAASAQLRQIVGKYGTAQVQYHCTHRDLSGPHQYCRFAKDLIQQSPAIHWSISLTNPDFNRLLTVSPDSALFDISNLLGASEYRQLAEDMTELVDMYCCLFDLEHVGLRLTVLDRAMCPNSTLTVLPVDWSVPIRVRRLSGYSMKGRSLQVRQRKSWAHRCWIWPLSVW